MKKIRNLLLVIFAIEVMVSGCDANEQVKINHCQRRTNDSVENQIGRIYFNAANPSDSFYPDDFYYIGGPDSTSREFAFIPCQTVDRNLLPAEEVGPLVIFSGTITVPFAYPEGVDPLFVGIDLTRIVKAD